MTSNPPKEWLEEVYNSRKNRTISITQKSIELLISRQEKISLNNIIKISREVDTKGISHSAILNNHEARKLYETYRNWLPSKKKLSNQIPEQINLYNLNIKTDRNLSSVKKRLSKLTKIQLMERLLIVEEAYALLHKKWLDQQSSMLEHD